MTPVHQEIVDPRLGDCVRACFASLMDLPLQDVPNFSALPTRQMWMHAQVQGMYHWLRPQGLDILEWSEPDPLPEDVYGDEPFHPYVIASGPSATFPDSRHVVIAERYWDEERSRWRARFVHDPNPAGRFIPHATDYLHIFRRKT